MYLSAVIITLNEERNIKTCLESLEGIVDEIVVVDSFSTDSTQQICESYGVQFIQRQFDGYGNQKRFATSQAKFDYILSLDADEELSQKLKESILKIKSSSQTSTYSFNRKNLYCGKWIRFCGWYPDKQIRLFDRRRINWNERVVHESIEDKNSKSIHLRGDLIHHTCNSIFEHQTKELKYAQMNARILVKKGKKISWILPYIKGGFRFFKTYILRLGVLDGYYGWVISTTLAKSSYVKYQIARTEIKLK
jgi:glycosyltransferase involved in cell wall biosynthesis